MKHNMMLPDLISFLNAQGIVLDERQMSQLRLYYDELAGWSRKMNLVSTGDIPHIVERHFLPSFAYVNQLAGDNIGAGSRILDLGTGSGLPGIILSIFFNEHRITLLDSSRKKILFLKSLIKKMELSADVILGRAESASELFDVVVARAVADIPTLIDLSLPLLNRPGFLYTMKGDDYRQEIKESLPENVFLTEVEIPESWIRFSPYLQNKLFIKIEFTDVKR
ncbi:MAG: 16S rRNA (guanine(527)-N(7))-methyltransferase RsmG [Calditrichaceae bacterium]